MPLTTFLVARTTIDTVQTITNRSEKWDRRSRQAAGALLLALLPVLDSVSSSLIVVVESLRAAEVVR